MAIGGSAGGGGGGGRRGTGPTKEELNIAQQLSTIMSQMAMQSAKISNAFESQAEATAKMAENMKDMGTGEVVNQLMQVNVTLKEVASALQNLNTTSAATFAAISDGALLAAGSTKQLSEAAKDATTSVERETTALEDLTKELTKSGKNALSGRDKMRALGDYLEKEFPVAVGAGLGALSGLRQGFRNIMSLGKGFLGFASTISGALFGIGKSILSIPFKLFSGLTDMAQSSGGGISEYAQALNNLRKEFGALGGPVTGAIQSTASSMAGFNVQGLSSYQVFGNVAERMEQLIKLFVAGGPALQRFNDEFRENGGAILGFQKGLGVSDEQMGAIANRAITTGTTVSKQLLDMTKQATHLGKEFGVDFKIISKGMAKAVADVKNFGSMSQKQIGVAVTYFAKLGVEIDKVTGVMDAFNTFDEAAEKVSTLNQVFGTNIDAMKLLDAENPAERVEILRKEFAKAGVAGEKLTRAQRQIIAQNAGIEESALQAALSSKNQGTSLEKISKEGDKAEKKTMTQAEAMNKLADAMDRVLKSGGDGGGGGFFDKFAKGFTDGISSSREFRAIMLNIRHAMRVVYLEGVRLGRAFVEFFPGIKEFLGGLADIFQPQKFKKLAGGVTDVFIQFFKDLGQPGGKASFSDLMDKLKEKFFDFFDSEKGAGQKLMGGFKKIMMAIQVILAGAVKWIMETMAGFIKNIVDFIKNPQGVPGVGKMTDAAENYISPIAMAFREGWTVLGPALKDLMKLLFEQLIQIVGELMDQHGGKIASVFFGPILTRALMGAGTAMLTKAIGGMITNVFGGGDVQKQMLDQMKGINEKLAGAAPAAPAGSGVPPITSEDTKSLKAMEVKLDWATIGKFLVGFAGVIIIGLLGFLAAVKLIQEFEIKKEETTQAIAIILGVATAALEVGVVMKMLEKLKTDNVGAVIKGLLGVGLVTVALGAVGVGIAYLVKTAQIGMSDVMTALTLVGGMALVALLVGGLTMGLMAVGSTFAGPTVALIVTGLVGVTLVVGALALMGYKLVSEVKEKNISGQDVEVAGKIMAVTSFAIGTAVKAMAAALGATVFAAISGLMKFFTGADPLEVLGTMVTSVTNVGLTIVEALKDVPRDIGPVVDAFVKILDSVATVMKVIPDTLKAMDFGFFESSKDQTNKINAVTGMIANLIGRDSGGEKIGIVGLMSTIIDGVKSMDTSNIEAAKAIAPVFQAVGSIMQGIGSTLSPIAAVASAIDDDDFEKVPAIIKEMGTFMGEVSKPFTAIVEAIKPLFETAKQMSATEAQGVQALAGLFQAIGPIAQAMQIPPGMADVLKAATQTKIGENAGDILKSMGKYMDSVGKAMKDYVMPAIKDSVVGMIEALKGATIEPAQAEVLKAIGPLLSTLVNFATSMAKPAMEAKNAGDALTKSSVVVTVLTSMGEHLPKIFKALSDNIKTVIDGVINVLKTVKVDPTTKSKVEYLGQVFSVVESIQKVADSIKLTEGKDNLSASDSIVSGIARVAIFLGRLVGEGKAAFGTTKAPLEELIGNVNAVTKVMGDASTLTKGATDFQKLMEGISSIVKVVGDIAVADFFKKDLTTLSTELSQTLSKLAELFKSFSGESGQALVGSLDEAIKAMSKVAPSKFDTMKTTYDKMGEVVVSFGEWHKKIHPITKASYEPQVKAMKEMIDAIAEIDAVISGTHGINIATTLDRFKANFGSAMGQTGSHVVQAKDVTINVNFVVAIDAEKLEGAILAANNSKLKEKINLVMNATSQLAGADKVPVDTSKFNNNTDLGRVISGTGTGQRL
jgi:hypothetical protein